MLNDMGIKVVRFGNKQIFNNIESVLDKIKSTVDKSY